VINQSQLKVNKNNNKKKSRLQNITVDANLQIDFSASLMPIDTKCMVLSSSDSALMLELDDEAIVADTVSMEADDDDATGSTTAPPSADER
jgi:hypothetical protein